MRVADELARSGSFVFFAACLLALQAIPGGELGATDHR